MMSSPIRLRVFLGHILILSVALGIFTCSVYGYLRVRLYKDLDALLLSRAEGVVNSIETYWGSEKEEALDLGVKAAALHKRRNLNFYRVALRWVEERSNDPDLNNIVVDILDDRGQIIASSSRQSRVSATDAQYRFVTVPVREEGRLAYVVRVGHDAVFITQPLSQLRLLFLFGVPLTILITGFSGLVLIRLTLKPVAQMTKTARDITAKKLTTRLGLPPGRDEIYQLAVTFNSMLSRLEHDFVAQRRLMEDLTHELKTPMAILKGELEVTLKKDRSIGEYQLALSSNLEETNRLIRLVDDLLFLARGDNQTLGLVLTSVNVTEELNDLLRQVRVLSQAKGQTLNAQLEQDVIIRADQDKIRRMLFNILENAVKYTPPGGRVDVGLKTKSGRAEVRVADTGIGISPQHLQRIFDRLFQVDPSRHQDGVGLGLSIARVIADAHGGTIAVDSTLGQGTVFTIGLGTIKNF